MKSILLASSSEAVAKALVDDLGHFGSGTLHDEMKWADVSVHASKIANASGNVLFLTDEEIMDAPRFVEEARASGRQIVTIPSTVKEKLSGQVDAGGNAIQDLSNFVSAWNESFEFKFVSADALTPGERSVLETTDQLAGLVGGLPSSVRKVNISETMRPEAGSFSEARGLWTGEDIVIKRSELASIESYAAVLLHEIGHARSGETDVTIGFEQELTALLGKVAAKALRKAPPRGEEQQQEQARPRSPDLPNAWHQPQAASRQTAPEKKSGFWARLFGKG